MASIEGEHRPGSLAQVTQVAWPIVISMLSFTAMGVADTLFVGWLGTEALAGVGLGTTAYFFFNSGFVGTLHGVKVISAQSTGAGDHDGALSAAWSGLALAIPMGLALLSLSLLGPQLFSLMGGSEPVREVAHSYFHIRAWSAPLAFLCIVVCDFYQGRGDTRTAMYVNLVANVLNVGLDAVLVTGWGPFPALGVAGAALATDISWLVAMVIALVIFGRREGLRWRGSWAQARRVLRLGLPMGINYVLNVSGMVMFASMLARMGDAQLAAHQIAFRVVSVSFLPGYGIGEAACVLVGQYVGAGRWEHARGALRSALHLGVAVMGLGGLAFWLAPGLLVGLFRPEADVVEIAVELLYVAALFQVLDAVAMVAQGALNGAGDTRFTMLASVAASWLLLLPLGYLMGVVLGWGAQGAWLGMTVEILALAAVYMARFRRKVSQHLQEDASAPEARLAVA